MKAQVGDRLVIHPTHMNEPIRQGEILEVHGTEGGPPYLVRWDDGHRSLSFPGVGAQVHHRDARAGQRHAS